MYAIEHNVHLAKDLDRDSLKHNRIRAFRPIIQKYRRFEPGPIYYPKSYKAKPM
jgi:hypothetical protein